MNTEIILIQDVSGLGAQGDVVKVAEGYARNYLFPQKLAAPATPKYVRMLELDKKRKEAAARRAMDQLRQEAEKLGQASCTITVEAGEDGKLFGSVTAQDIADSLAQAGFTVDKRKVNLAEPIRELGVYTVEVKLYSDVAAAVKVWVVQK